MNNPQQYTYVKKCHTGNTLLYTYPNGGSLYIGGWNQGATFNYNTHVIDLTGNEHRFVEVATAFDEVSKGFMPYLRQSYAGWLSLPFPDFSIPRSLNTREQWEGITEVVRNILKTGKDVLVACHGGHGRSGLFCSIVGYLLAHGTDQRWNSPVEHVRLIHCDDAVETIEQEKFVYNILGLRIKIERVYADPFQQYDNWTGYGGGSNLSLCPICGTNSAFVKEFGMCMGCKNKYFDAAPVRSDLTINDIKGGGLIEHTCNNEKCMGIWKAAKCGHVTHDMIVYEGYCEICAHKNEEAEKALANPSENCAICTQNSNYSDRFGVCYECAEFLYQSAVVDDVHNSITDPYRAVPHTCTDEVHCVGVIRADVCGHVIHNREVEDGLCPECQVERNKRNHKED